MPDGGCYEAAPIEWTQGLFSEVCPTVYLHEYIQLFEVLEWIEKDRLLPYSGGILEQPWLLMQYIKLIRAVLNGR